MTYQIVCSHYDFMKDPQIAFKGTEFYILRLLMNKKSFSKKTSPIKEGYLAEYFS